METSVTDVLEHISDAFYALDANWCFTYVNGRAAARWGRASAELVGCTLWETFPQVLGTRFEEEHRRVASTRTPAHFEMTSPVFGGWLEIRIHPTADGLSVYFHDVSTRTRTEQELRRDETEAALRRSERLHRALVQQAGEGVWLTDLSGCIHEVNPAACEMLGYTREELLQLRITELFPAPFLERREADLEQMRAGATITSAREMVCKDGRIIQVEGTARLVSSDLLLSFTRDITERHAIQAALRASDERYRAFLAQSSEGIWRCELDQPIPVDLPPETQVNLMYERAYLAECNDAFARMYGLSGAADVTGARLTELLVRTDPANTEYLLAFIRSGYRLENAESHEQDAAGNPKVFLNNLVGFIEEGCVVRAWGLQRDVTEQRRVEEAIRQSEWRFRTLALAGEALFSSRDSVRALTRLCRLCVEHVADACFIDVFGTRGEIQRLAESHRDPALQPVLGEIVAHVPTSPDSPHPLPRALFHGEVTLVPEVERDWLAEIATSARHQELMERMRPRSLITVPLRAGGAILGCITVTLTEASAPRRFGPADRELMEEIARRAGTAMENARFYSELQDADRRKDQFLAMLAHELRNPLAPIAAAAELLHTSPADPGSVQRQSEVIARNTDHLARLVDDLLEVSRITQDKISLRLAPADLVQIVHQAVTNTRLQFDAKQQRLELELPAQAVVVEADTTRLVQVLVNLLSNASKYTGDAGRIRLSLEQKQAPARVVLRIGDDGCGIEPGLLPRVFDLFVQGDRSLAHAQGGLGIGLTLVRRLVEMHGGTVEARSEGVGRGAEFIITLPTASPPPAGDGPAEITGTVAAQRVLVVDDNVDAAETLGELLELWGHEVEIAHDGPAALTAVSGFRPSLILLDLGLPGMDGYEVARRLAGIPEREHARLVALTGYAGEEDRRRTADLGFDAHLGKPVDLDVLRRLLAETRQ